jgi:xanthine/CO dehydrogenase XdhC/CoxF family maturation factor
MANHVQQLLNHWYSQRDTLEWVLATIVDTQGSSYRKAGAMMMINSLGQHYGLLSGGCLESDIMRQARQCWDTRMNKLIEYDMREEEDLAWQLGIGCGGLVKILLQPVLPSNNYIGLVQLRAHLNNRITCEYCQRLNSDEPSNSVKILTKQFERRLPKHASVNNEVFTHIVEPCRHLAIFGGGVDAIPLVNIAVNLGWEVTLIDPRPSYGRKREFGRTKRIIKTPIGELRDAEWLNDIDAAVMMMHNVDLDAQALILCQQSAAGYVGLLGPIHRTDQVLARAQLTRLQLRQPLANPIGLQLGGELPESIALSILAEMHAFFERACGDSISGVLRQPYNGANTPRSNEARTLKPLKT